MDWDDYLKKVISSETVFDSFILSCNEEVLHVSPIVKASILMLDDVMSNNSIHNIFVFPEIDHTLKQFLILKVVFDISIGKIRTTYNPQNWQKGQILKFEGCFVEFKKIETGKDGFTRIFVNFAGGDQIGLPIEIAPFFQKCESKRLSKWERFNTKYSALDAIKVNKNPALSKNFIEGLANHKTHLNGSVFFVSPIKYAKDFFSSALINDRKISEILYIAQVNGDGELSNLFPGQLSGNPAIIIASDIYAVQNAINKGIVPQSIIIDVSQSNTVEKQLDAFDRLGRDNLPVVCVTNTANSFELSALINRHYSIWRWDSASITESVISSEVSISNKRVCNCADFSLDYRRLNDDYLSTAVWLLYGQKNTVEEQPSKIITAYDKLFSLALLMVKNVTTLDESNLKKTLQTINECINDIENEKHFISKDLYDNLSTSAKSLLHIFESTYTNNKYEEIYKIVLTHKDKSICIVISEKQDKINYQEYWENIYWYNFGLPCKISVMYPQEYQEHPDCCFDLVVVAGWFGDKKMRNIIYSFVSPNYIVLIYPCEERWKNYQTKKWEITLNNSSNVKLIKEYFSKGQCQISTARFEHPEAKEVISSEIDEFDDIELILKATKFRRYGGNAKSAEIVDAYPVNFVGGCLAFYRSGHKALVATDIISNNGDKIIFKLPEKLAVGDYIVIRESGRDMVRIIADLILERSGKADIRNLSLKWKDALLAKTRFYSYEEIYRRLYKNGCDKDYATVRNWITNDDLIQPNDKEDLCCIVKTFGDQILYEKLDDIYEAGKDVRRAHIQAGRVLSSRLKQKIGEYLQNVREANTINLWEPISLQIEEIGQVKILRIIDINDVIPVDAGNTNRLLYE